MKTLIENIQEKEKLSRELDPGAGGFAHWWRPLGRFAQEFLAEIDGAPAYQEPRPFAPAGTELPADPSDLETVLEEFRNLALAGGIHPVSGRFFGYVPGGGLPAAAVGDFLAALTNRYAGAYHASPGAAEIENRVTEWLRRMAGFPQGSWGSLQSGGSLATLTALVAARSTLPSADWGRAVVYHSSEWHHAIPKALKIAGLESCPRRQVPVTPELRMNAEALEALIEADRRAGLRPWLLCASAGTTNTGAVDPLEDLAAAAGRHGLWLHVDAAYGGFFVLAPSGRDRLRGMELADSLVLDPHKGLFLPYGCGAVLVRDGDRLKASLAATSDYLRDVEGAERSPMDYSPELTRHFRGLRLWLALRLHGLERFRAALEEKLLLARYAYGELRSLAGISVGPYPQLSAVTFRAQGEGERADEATMRLLRTLLKRGTVHLSSTRLHDRVYLRLCILCFRSHLREVDQALEEVRSSL